MVEKVDRVNAFIGPSSLTVQEGRQVMEVYLTRTAKMDGVLVAASASLGRPTLLLVQIDSDAKLLALEFLT